MAFPTLWAEIFQWLTTTEDDFLRYWIGDLPAFGHSQGKEHSTSHISSNGVKIMLCLSLLVSSTSQREDSNACRWPKTVPWCVVQRTFRIFQRRLLLGHGESVGQLFSLWSGQALLHQICVGESKNMFLVWSSSEINLPAAAKALTVIWIKKKITFTYSVWIFHLAWSGFEESCST